MTRSEYWKQNFEAYNAGRISAEAFDAAIENAENFCDDEETGFVIVDENGREIAYCDEDYTAAEILCEAVGGDRIIPADEYEEPENDADEYDYE